MEQSQDENDIARDDNNADAGESFELGDNNGELDNDFAHHQPDGNYLDEEFHHQPGDDEFHHQPEADSPHHQPDDHNADSHEHGVLVPPPLFTIDDHVLAARASREKSARRLKKNREYKGESAFGRFFRQVGGAGFIASVVFHALLICFAVFWVTRAWIESDNNEDEPVSFVSGAGGGNGGDRPSWSEKSGSRRPRIESTEQHRILTKSAISQIVLPEANVHLHIPQATGNKQSFDGSGFASSGAGGGVGGGVGIGKGIGVGDGKNFVSKFKPRKVMGVNIYADKIAVYLDCSPSMTPYLERVSEEIYNKYPDADIFEFNAILTTIVDGEVLGGKSGKVVKHPRDRRGRGDSDLTDRKKLSRQGEAVYKKYSKNFEIGSVGAWLDIMIQEKYDALVIFSDFQDGIRQFDKSSNVIYADSIFYPTTTDGRKERDLKWFKRWIDRLKNKTPKIYLYTIEQEPQSFLAECVKVSGGEISNVEYLRRMKTRGYEGEDTAITKKSIREKIRKPRNNDDDEEQSETERLRDKFMDDENSEDTSGWDW